MSSLTFKMILLARPSDDRRIQQQFVHGACSGPLSTTLIFVIASFTLLAPILFTPRQTPSTAITIGLPQIVIPFGFFIFFTVLSVHAYFRLPLWIRGQFGYGHPILPDGQGREPPHMVDPVSQGRQTLAMVAQDCRRLSQFFSIRDATAVFMLAQLTLLHLLAAHPDDPRWLYAILVGLVMFIVVCIAWFHWILHRARIIVEEWKQEASEHT